MNHVVSRHVPVKLQADCDVLYDATDDKQSWLETDTLCSRLLASNQYES